MTTLAILLTAACSGGPLEDLDGFVGSWEGTHRILGDDTVHAAGYEIGEDKGALVWEFRSAWSGGFTGRGVQLWDAAAGNYVETWTDAGSAEPSTQRGNWSATTATLLMRSEGADWETGETIPYQHRTVLHTADHWSYVMIAERADGPIEVMWIEMKRK